MKNIGHKNVGRRHSQASTRAEMLILSVCFSGSDTLVGDYMKSSRERPAFPEAAVCRAFAALESCAAWRSLAAVF
tara:strand:- start:175 stop:399 length:225 start_codon:yes stop_codon:yes gene_type:complete